MTATIIHGDCLDVLRGMADASVDAVVTDPPWMDYETGWYDASEWHAPIVRVHPAAYAGELFRVMRDASAAIVWCRWDCFEEHAQAMRDAGFTVKSCIVWAKPNHTAGDLAGNLGAKHEMAVFAVKGRWKRSAGRETNLWEEQHLFSRAKRAHPTQKPVALMRWLVRLVTPPDGTILDPFAGSGTTLVAALAEGRQAIGIEREAEYVEIVKARLANAEAA